MTLLGRLGMGQTGLPEGNHGNTDETLTELTDTPAGRLQPGDPGPHNRPDLWTDPLRGESPLYYETRG